jgi:hypothetical protein
MDDLSRTISALQQEGMQFRVAAQNFKCGKG